jgi:hypothetical protein
MGSATKKELAITYYTQKKKTIVSSLLKGGKGEVILIGLRSGKLYRLQMKVIILKAWSLKIGENHSKCYIFWNFI